MGLRVRPTPADSLGQPARLDPPPEVRRIAARLHDAGFETWCVGGAVRDALLGQAHADWDLATAATPEQVRALFKRTVPHGIDYGTIGVLDRAGVMHEVTTFRRDVRHDGRHAVVEYGVSLDDDLARRDFTINAIAYSPATNEVRDPFGGREDLKRRVVRAVGDPRARMTEDRLRALRALRFAGRFGFTIDPATWDAIVESAPYLPRLSRERVRQEIEKTMEQVRRPSRCLELWRRSGAFGSLIPELALVSPACLATADWIGLPDATTRPELAEARRRNRMASIFLELDPRTARSVLEGLRSSRREVDWAAHVVACWHRLSAEIRGGPGVEPTDRALRQWASVIGRTQVGDFLRIAAARRASEGPVPPGEARAGRSAYRRAVRIAFHDPIAVADLAVDGGDLMDAGIPAGPAIGETLRRLLGLVLEDPARNRREELLALAREWAGKAG